MENTLDTHLSTKVRLSEVRQRTDSEDNPGTRALQQSAQDNQLIQVLQQLHDHMTNLSQSREKEPNSQVILSPALETDMKFVWKVTKYTPDETVRQHIADIVCQSGFLEVCDKFWMICHWKTMWLFDVDNYPVFRVLKLCLLIMWSISDISSEFCQSLCDSGFVNTFQLTLASHFKSERPFLNNDRVASYAKCLLGILHNVARLREDSHPVMRQNLKLFKLFSQSDHLMVKTKATMILSYLVKESETNMIVSNLETITFMALLLRNAIESPFHFSTKFGISALEVLNGLNNLAANDENKVKIIDAGCLPLYAGMLQPDCTDKEQLLAAKGLWLISFCEERREEFFKCDCTEALKRLEKSENEALCHASRGALWELQNKAPIGPTDTNFSINTEMSANVPHVMISYQWDSKPIMLRLKDRLKQSGYKVWMDVEHMSGSTLEAMALAVERAAVVIVAMSQKYKDSPSCRTEAEYTYKLRKAVLPLQVEDGYIADGWLGMLVGTRLYISVHGADCVDITLPKIVSELGCRGKPEVPRRVRGLGQKSHSVDMPFTGMAQKTNVNMTCLQSDWRRWTDAQVSDWLISTGIENRSNFPVLDGSLLQELQRMLERAPSCFYTTLKTDLQLSLKESLQMTKALSTLT